MPFKTFVAGQSATAAEANTYLMRQSVAQFPDYAAAVAAYSAPTAGAQFILPDGEVWTYASGAWRLIPRRGRTSVTTDSSNYANISHGLGTTPSLVIATGGGPASGSTVPGMVVFDSATSSTFRVRVWGPAGTTGASMACYVNWVAWP